MFKNLPDHCIVHIPYLFGIPGLNLNTHVAAFEITRVAKFDVHVAKFPKVFATSSQDDAFACY
jgi:hypothetical protein